MARIDKSEKGQHSRTADRRPCSTASRASGDHPPTLRLTGVRPMTTAQQQRFEMLFDALIAHWLSRSDQREGKPND